MPPSATSSWLRASVCGSQVARSRALRAAGVSGVGAAHGAMLAVMRPASPRPSGPCHLAAWLCGAALVAGLRAGAGAGACGLTPLRAAGPRLPGAALRVPGSVGGRRAAATAADAGAASSGQVPPGSEQGVEAHRSWRRCRLERELRAIGLDPAVLEAGHAPHAQILALPAVEAFLEPSTDEELAVARLPGRARFLAGVVAEALLEADGSAGAPRNHDRTEGELEQRPLGPRAPLVVVLEGPLNPEEVGCLLRTCETAHVCSVVLCGETPGPPDKGVLKASLGAERHLPHSRAVSAEAALRELRASGHTLWSLAGTRPGTLGAASAEEDAGNLCADLGGPPPRPLALVIGAGDAGQAAAAAALCDGSAWLPIHGSSGGSLAASVAGSVAIFDILRHWGL